MAVGILIETIVMLAVFGVMLYLYWLLAHWLWREIDKSSYGKLAKGLAKLIVVLPGWCFVISFFVWFRRRVEKREDTETTITIY